MFFPLPRLTSCLCRSFLLSGALCTDSWVTIQLTRGTPLHLHQIPEVDYQRSGSPHSVAEEEELWRVQQGGVEERLVGLQERHREVRREEERWQRRCNLLQGK